MLVTIRRPRRPLDRYVGQIMCLSGYAPDHHRELVVPDGSTFIIVDLTDRSKHCFRAPDCPTTRDFRGGWVSGIQSGPIEIEAQRGASFLIIRFLPGGVAPFVPVCPRALANGIAAGDAVLGATAAASLRDRVLEAPDQTAMIDRAEHWLLERAGSALPTRPAVIDHMLARIAARPDIGVERLADETGYSARHVRNLFDAWVGIGPKRLGRLVRFDRMVTRLIQPVPPRNETPVRWVDLAQDGGFADQPHLIAEFKAMSGLTPTRFVARSGGRRNFLPLPDGPNDRR